MAGKLKKMRRPEELDLEMEFEAPEMEDGDEAEMYEDDEAEESPSESPSDLVDKLEEQGYDVSDLRKQLEAEGGDDDDEEDLDTAEPVPMWNKPETV